MIKTLIVDDEVIFRESLKYLVEQDEEITVVGCAGNAQEAFELCGKLGPDLILMDIFMPVCNGVEGTRRIKLEYPSIKVIILTTFEDDQNITEALQNGADGYVLKDIMPGDLMLTIKGVAKGMGIVHHRVLQTMAKQVGELHDIKVLESEKPKINLTPREMDLIRLIVDGKNNREIAASLYLAEGSVKNLLSDILLKLQLKDRTQLAVYAVKKRMV